MALCVDLESEYALVDHNWDLSYAIGYLQLGMPEDALDRLHAVSYHLDEMDDGEVATFQNLLSSAVITSGNDADASRVTEEQLNASPKVEMRYIDRAEYLLRFRGPKEAVHFLCHVALPIFPENLWLIYNLACSLSLDGQQKAAGEQLARLCVHNQKHALVDPDLAGLWKWVGERSIEALLKKLELK